MLILRQNTYAEKDSVDKGLQTGITLGGLGSLYYLIKNDKLKGRFKDDAEKFNDAISSRSNINKMTRWNPFRKLSKAYRTEVEKVEKKAAGSYKDAQKVAKKIRRNRKLGLGLAAGTLTAAAVKALRKKRNND